MPQPLLASSIGELFVTTIYIDAMQEKWREIAMYGGIGFSRHFL